MHAPVAQKLNRRDLRDALGSFATGIIVVTASYEGSQHGMTANSFTSVSLEPPLVLVCIDNNARMAHLLERGMEFGLSILSVSQERISRHFAGRPQDGLAIDFAWRAGIPLIAGAHAHFRCQLADSHVVGDHTIFIAEVRELERYDAAPLVFHRGQYCSLVDHQVRSAAAELVR